MLSVLTVWNICDSLSQNFELAIVNHAAYFKLLLMLLMIVNKRGKKLFPVCKTILSKGIVLVKVTWQGGAIAMVKCIMK